MGSPANHQTNPLQQHGAASKSAGSAEMPAESAGEASPAKPAEEEPGCLSNLKTQVKALSAKWKEFGKTRPGAVLSLFMAVGMAAWSMASVVSAYNELKDNTGNINDLVDNWQTAPLYNVTVVPNGAACPSGFKSLTTTAWPGADMLYCVCPSGASWDGDSFSTSGGSCSTNATKAGCSAPSNPGYINRRDMTSMTSSIGSICAQARGPPAIAADGKVRPAPVNGQCESGWRTCGTGSGNNSFCWPTSEPECPVTRAEVITLAAYMSNTAAWSSAVNLPGDATRVLAIARGESFSTGSVQLPVVDSFGAYSGQVFRFDRGARSWDGQATVGNKFPMESQYTLLDTRYSSIASFDMKTAMQQSFPDPMNPATCQPGVTWRDGSPTPCSSGDSVCNFMTQPVCDQWTGFLNAASGTWDAVSRYQLPWKAQCEVTMSDVQAHQSPVNDLLGKQQALMIVNIISNSVSMLIALLVCLSVFSGDLKCIPGSGEGELYLLKLVKTWVSALGKAPRIALVVIVTIIVANIKGFFPVAAQSECGDAITTETLQYFADTLTRVYSKNIQACVADGVSLLMLVVTIIGELTDGVSVMDKANNRA